MFQISNILPHYLNYEKLISLAEKQMSSDASCLHRLISLDFDNFNYINDLFGYNVGDQVLARFTEHLSRILDPGEYFCHLHADQYLLWVLKWDTATVKMREEKLTDLKKTMEHILPDHYNLVISGGSVQATSAREAFSSLVDKANFARKRAKGHYKSTFLPYDETMEQDIKWRKTLTLMMENALHNIEFEMYLQPKIIIKTDQIAGAEALVRWKSNDYGMIFPDRFIPIMEQNGFIRQLDFFILKQACRYLKHCKQNNVPVLPISVNFSKLHIRDTGFVDEVYKTVASYAVHPGFIEIEFTENVFTDDLQSLINVSSALKYLGFHVALDDFGSAYSSLNCLKDIPLDVIKIDKSFLNDTTGTEKGQMIIAKVVELIKSLRITCVMEGIETEEQLEFLKKLGCDIGQGYFYARPMTAEDYTRFLLNGTPSLSLCSELNEQIDTSSLYAIPQEFELDNWELFTLVQNIDIGLMKGYLDGEATIQYANDKAIRYLGYSRQEFRETFHNRITAFTHPDDTSIVLENARLLIKNGSPIDFHTRAVRKDGKIIVLEGRASCVTDANGRNVGIYAFQDVTDALEREKSFKLTMESKIAELEKAVDDLHLSEERYRLIMEQSRDIMFEWDFKTDSISLSDQYQKTFGREPICSHFSTNPETRKRVHPDDLASFEEWIQNTYGKPDRMETEFRLQTSSGIYIWLHGRSTAICNQKGTPVKVIGVFSNIDASKREIEKLTKKSQLDPLTKLFNKEETRIRIEEWLTQHPSASSAFFIIDADNFKAVNDTLGHHMGDTALVEMASCIKGLFRDDDITGRIGGDEIVVFAAGFESKDELIRRASALISSVQNSRLNDQVNHLLSISIGISHCPEHGNDFETLYRLADVALYVSKQNGKGCSTIYHEGISNHERSTRTPVDCHPLF